MLAGGATNPEIAAALHLSERTVAHHVSAILSKLGTPTRTAAVAAARNAGLLGPKDGPVVGQLRHSRRSPLAGPRLASGRQQTPIGGTP